ncbi:MAG TPA: hypothetical protein PLB32_14655 [Acidobacteriota bacterium]|nr:hypothetical protein [Acidobacteriota bacterium]
MDQNTQKAEMKNLISRNISVGVAAKAFYMVTRVFLPPLILSHVSLEEYGIWATCFILISYLGMSAFGVSNVYIRYVAEFRARQEYDKINRLLSTGMTFILVLSLGLMAGLWFVLPMVISGFKISPALAPMAFQLIYITALTFVLDLSLGAFSYVLIGLQKITEQNLVWVATFCLEAVLIVVFLLTGFGIYSLLWAFVIRYVVAIVAYVVLCYRTLPTLKLTLGQIDRESLRLFTGYGSVVQVTGILSMVLYSIEKVIAGAFLGVQSTALFDIGEKLPVMTSQIPSSMNMAFVPAMSHLATLEQKAEVIKLYLKGSRYLNTMTGLMMGFLAAFAAPLLTIWIGHNDQFEVAALIMVWFCLPYQMNVLTGPGSGFHRGNNRPVRELLYPVSQAICVVLAVGTGFLIWGKTIQVITIAVAISMVASAVWYMAFTNRTIGITQVEFLRRVLVPGLVPYGFGMLVRIIVSPALHWAGSNRWILLVIISLAGVLYCGLVLGFFYRALCDWNEREFLRRQITHTLGSFFRFNLLKSA